MKSTLRSATPLFAGVVSLALLGCGVGPTREDAGLDGGVGDAGSLDAGSGDAGSVDGGPFDAGFTDAGHGDAGSIDAGAVDAGVFTLASSVLDAGAVFPVRYTCADTGTLGKVSPPLSWTVGPSALSYTPVMVDTSINLTHWVIWDLPASASDLQEGISNVAAPAVPAGAKQTTSYDNTTYGYRGPCPPANHLYRFTVYALDVATLPGVTTASSRAQVQTAIAGHAIGSAALTGNYGP